MVQTCLSVPPPADSLSRFCASKINLVTSSKSEAGRTSQPGRQGTAPPPSWAPRQGEARGSSCWLPRLSSPRGLGGRINHSAEKCWRMGQCWKENTCLCPLRYCLSHSLDSAIPRQSSSELSSDLSSAATFQFFLLLLFSGTSACLSDTELWRFFLFLGGRFSFFSSDSLSSELLVVELLAWEKSLSCPEDEVGSLAGTFLVFFLRLCFPFRVPEVSSLEHSLSWEESDDVLPCSFFFFFRFLCERFFCFFLCDFFVFFRLCDPWAVCFLKWDFFFPLTVFCSSPSCWSLQEQRIIRRNQMGRHIAAEPFLSPSC